MSVLRRVVKNWLRTEETFTNLSGWPGPMSRTGVTVTRDRALQLATVWACVRARAEDLGALPIDIVERRDKQRIQKPWPTWLESPNPETTTYELIEFTSASIDTNGNAFWMLFKDNAGRLAEVWPLPPSQVEVYRDKAPRDDPKKYMPKRFRIGNEEFGADKILQIRGFSLPGRLRGLNPIEQHAHALGLAVAAEEFGETFFGNGAVMSGVIEAPADPGKPDADRMRDSFAADHAGLRNAHRPGFLFGGAKWVQLSITNEASQFLETRKYQREEICAIYRVPPHKAQILDRATFSNIEHQGIEWVTDGLMPGAVRIERAVVGAGLLDRGDRMKFNFKGHLRGDTAARYASYAIGRQWGWLSADDIREYEDEDPLPDGKGADYLVPLNMVPAGDVQVETAKALRRAGVEPALALQAAGLDPGIADLLADPTITEEPQP